MFRQGQTGLWYVGSNLPAVTRGIGPKLGRWVNRMNTYMGQKSNERGLELDVAMFGETFCNHRV